jgi:hypothetical protein
MMSSNVLIAGLVSVLVLAPGFRAPVAAQVAQESGAVRVTAQDSALLLRAARQDQAAFERLRRNRLPETWGSGSGRCDERIGRFCLTHGSPRGTWTAPPEHPDVVASRDTLVHGLGLVAEIIPGDGWIAGQRVRYLVEARRLDEALLAAGACRAERSWCAALLGFVHHYASRAAAADSAFDTALAAMEEPERRRWNDLSLILDEQSVRSYRRMAPEGREEFEHRFWRLADPFLTRPGNELRSEHFSRHVRDQFQYRAQSADGISWGYDLREILLRYGWPAGWERHRNWGMTAGPPPLTSHYSSAPQYLLPPPEALLGESGTEGTWEITGRRSRTGYNIPLEDSIARWFSPLDHQVAVFRRGAESVVIAAYQLPADSVPESARVEAGLALLETADDRREPDVALAPGVGATGRMLGRTDARQVLMSLEVVVPEERRLARARYGLDLPPLLPGLLSMSDLLLLSGGEDLPESLEEAVEMARPSARIPAGEEVGVYWEIYGVDPERTEQVTLSIRLLESRRGWVRRLAERAGLLREVTPIRLRWQEPTVAGTHMPRSLAIQIPEVAPGSYTLELTLEADGREPLSVRKDIEVTGG